jgi:NTP pyrophosphatase (non-canonical NTP hydrolase)
MPKRVSKKRRPSSRPSPGVLGEGVATLSTLTAALVAFRRERHWEQFHNPKDQALSLVLEAAELLELTQWKNGRELDEHLAANREALADELADVIGWCLLIAHDQNIDPGDACRKKLAKNVAKYPAEKVRGSAKKYSEYKAR